MLYIGEHPATMVWKTPAHLLMKKKSQVSAEEKMSSTEEFGYSGHKPDMDQTHPL